MTRLAIAASLGAICFTQPAFAAFTAYNDFVNSNAGSAVNVTAIGDNGSGSLINFADAAATGVTLAVSDVNTSPSGATPASGPANTAFAGIVDLTGYITDTVNETLTLSGLNPLLTYNLALGVHRNDVNNVTSSNFQLTGATGFVNSSTAGSTILTTSVTDDTTQLPAQNPNGVLVEWTSIDPGADGIVVINLLAGSNARWYLQGLRLIENPVPEPASFILMGLGGAAMFGRRRK